MSGNGWTLWLDMVAEEHRERMLRALPADFFGDTRPCRDITDGFELDTEPYRLSLDTPTFPARLDCILELLKEVSDDGSLLQ